MPRAKTAVSKKSPTKSESKDESALMEFEQFISQTPRPRRNYKALLATFLIVVIIALVACLAFLYKGTPVDNNLKFKAVYLENGQIYYAKVVKEDNLNVYLDEVYYIDTQEVAIPSGEGEETATTTVPVLVKRGQELNKPQGWLQLNRSKVVAIEEIGPDSEIIKEIEKVNQAQ